MISNRCTYALKAMLELALREGEGPVSIGEIAREQGIPARFLEAILRQLKQAGYTRSARGKVGGYQLARPANGVRTGEIIRLFEGPLLAPGGPPPPGAGPDPLAALWRQAEAALAQVYDAMTFAELARQAAAARKLGVDYAI
jgi:Rrf2 family transcriptional regulator, cysteine metabolism repressor